MKVIKTDRRDEIIEDIRKNEDALNEAIREANEAIEEANEKIAAVRSLSEDLDQSINELEGWAEGIAEEIDEYINARSDAWQDSERGQQYDEWRSQWQTLYFGNSCDSMPEEIKPISDVSVGSEAITDIESVAYDVDNI